MDHVRPWMAFFLFYDKLLTEMRGELVSSAVPESAGNKSEPEEEEAVGKEECLKHCRGREHVVNDRKGSEHQSAQTREASCHLKNELH